jgi:hypothetical protein
MFFGQVMLCCIVMVVSVSFAILIECKSSSLVNKTFSGCNFNVNVHFLNDNNFLIF